MNKLKCTCGNVNFTRSDDGLRCLSCDMEYHTKDLKKIIDKNNIENNRKINAPLVRMFDFTSRATMAALLSIIIGMPTLIIIDTITPNMDNNMRLGVLAIVLVMSLFLSTKHKNFKNLLNSIKSIFKKRNEKLLYKQL